MMKQYTTKQLEARILECYAKLMETDQILAILGPHGVTRQQIYDVTGREYERMLNALAPLKLSGLMRQPDVV